MTAVGTQTTPTRTSVDGPRVSVVLPVFNEEPCIDQALWRLRTQTWGDLEIIVADGGSNDETQRIVRRHAAEDPRVRLMINERRLQAAGLNEMLQVAQGEILVRVDGHSFVDHDYVERSVRVMEETGAAVVGGRMVAQPDRSVIARGVAIANEAIWGAGPARFHRAGQAGPAETVYLGTFRREAVRAVQGWSEDVGVNEDYELNHRIRAAGGVVWFDPALGVGYRPRSSLRAVARQYFRYGRSKATVMRRHPRSIRVRQILPAVLLPLGVLGLVSRRVRPVAAIAVVAHGSLVAAGAASAPAQAPVRASAGAAAWLMHWAWSVGMWFGLIRKVPSAEEIAAQSREDQYNTRPPSR